MALSRIFLVKTCSIWSYIHIYIIWFVCDLLDGSFSVRFVSLVLWYCWWFIGGFLLVGIIGWYYFVSYRAYWLLHVCAFCSSSVEPKRSASPKRRERRKLGGLERGEAMAVGLPGHDRCGGMTEGEGAKGCSDWSFLEFLFFLFLALFLEPFGVSAFFFGLARGCLRPGELGICQLYLKLLARKHPHVSLYHPKSSKKPELN